MDFFDKIKQKFQEESPESKSVDSFSYSQMVYKKRNYKIWIVGALSVLIIVAAFFLVLGRSSFNREDIKIEILAPRVFEAGDEVVYAVVYKNNSRVLIKNLEMDFEYPKKSISVNTGENLREKIQLENLYPGQEQRVEFKARVFGEKNEAKGAKAVLGYKPENMNTRFSSETTFTSIISIVPSGQELSFVLSISSQTNADFENLRLRIDYPPGFDYKGAVPEPSDLFNIWDIDFLTGNKEEDITINGVIAGLSGEIKNFKAVIGSYNRETREFIPYNEISSVLGISVSPLSVNLFVNGVRDFVAEAGNNLSFRIKFANNSDVGIEEGIIKAQIEGEVLDLLTLDIKNGNFSSLENSIIWKAGTFPALKYLAPHEEGEVVFSISLKKSLPINDFSDKNFIVKSLVQISSSKIPSVFEGVKFGGDDSLEIKVGSFVDLRAKAYYNAQDITNTGPIPPKVGETTTYTISWQILNGSNDIEDLRVKAALPTNVEWTGRVVPQDADVEYNPNTGIVTWNVGFLPFATGILRSVRQVSFQVSVTPSLSDVDALMELIKESSAEAIDSFTELNLESKSKEIFTDLPDDPKKIRDMGVVVR